MRTSRGVALGVVLLALTVAPRLWACPVCYGGSDSGFLDGARLSVLFMGILTYALIGGGVGIFLALRRRVRRLQNASAENAQPDLRLIRGSSPPEGAAS